MRRYFALVEHNIKFVFLFTISFWSANSIISEQILSGYLFVLTKSNEPVGLVKGVQSLCQLICSFPAGIAADTLRRDQVLVVAGCVGLCAAVLSGAAFEMADMTLIYIAFALWGVFTALQSPAMEALFADSVPPRQRSFPFTLKHILLNTAQVIGPICGILLFVHYGDDWQLPVLREVLVFGTFLASLSMVLLFQFDDGLAFESQQHELEVERVLSSIERPFEDENSQSSISNIDNDQALIISAIKSGEEDPDEEDQHHEHHHDHANTTSSSEHTNASERTRLLVSPINAGALNNLSYSEIPSPPGPPRRQHDSDQKNQQDQGDPSGLLSQRNIKWCGLASSHVPYLLFLSDFVISNGTGLTSSFFSLFFLNEYQLSPIQVQYLFVLQPLCVALLAYLAQQLTRVFGRMPVVVLCRLIGACCLLLMAKTSQQHIQYQFVFFLLRAGMMQCTEPLRRSVLMDFVSRKVRARWNSLEGLSMFSWTGSAVVGGFLIEAYGYRFCFFLASIVYFFGTFLEALLIPLTCHAIEL